MRLTLFLALALAAPSGAYAQPASDAPRTIERVKGSVVAVGTFHRTRAPQFRFLGTGFAVGDGATIVTNAHVLPAKLDAEQLETIAIVVPRPGREVQVRQAMRGAVDPAHDLALLRIEGAPLPALAVRDSDGVREGELVLFTGFPIGNVLGPFPATHRGMVAAITPIAIPPAHSSQLNPRVPYAWLLRLGPLSIPLFIASRTLDSWWDCLRAGRYYGLRWFEMPAAFAIAIYVHLLEIGGMRAAFADARAGAVAAAEGGGHAPHPSSGTLDR